MAINNFEKINKMLKFESNLDFYFIQIIKRRKDNPGMTGDAHIVDIFYLYKEGDLSKLEDKIINICEANRARAYIHLNRRNLEVVALQTQKRIVENIINKQFHAVKNAYPSVCGSYSAEKENRKWFIDFDEFDENKINELVSVIDGLYPIKNETKLIETIPTPNGYHIIVSPFDLKEFAKIYPDVGVQKDNPTVLYVSFKLK